MSTLRRVRAWQQIGREAFQLTRSRHLINLKKVMSTCEVLLIIEAWDAYENNISDTARALGLCRKTIRKVVNECREAREDP